MSRYAPKPGIVEAVRWEAHGTHPKVRTPAGAAPDRFTYGIVDTPIGPKPIERGDWIVTDEAGGTVPWRPEHFAQMFARVDEPPADPFA